MLTFNEKHIKFTDNEIYYKTEIVTALHNPTHLNMVDQLGNQLGCN